MVIDNDGSYGTCVQEPRNSQSDLQALETELPSSGSFNQASCRPSERSERSLHFSPFRVAFRLGWLTDMPDQQIVVGIDAPFQGSPTRLGFITRFTTYKL